MIMNDIKLFPHQQTALDETNDLNRVAYYLDMGLGKTYVGSEKMIQLGEKVNLLICQKSKIQDWIHHFAEYYSDILIYDLTNKKQFDEFFEFGINNLIFKQAIGIINYDLAFRRPELLKLENFTLMLDESSIIQNETTKRSKFVLKLRASNVILLSGTPTSGKYENLYSQLKLLGWKISKDLYWKQYIEVEWIENDDGFPIKRVSGYKNVDRLKMKLRQYGAVFMKSEEVFDLPDMITVKIPVKATKDYKKFVRSSMITLGDIELIGDTVLTKRLYSRMLCGHYNQDKLDALKDLIDSTEDRLIVFYNFNDELNLILNLIGDRPVSIINGSTKDLSAYEDHDDAVTLVQYQAGAMGLNLQKANKIIYFTLPEKSELFEQSKKRIHRIGQTQRCFYYIMMVENSIEEDVLSTLEMRKDYTDELFRSYETKN
jgi:SNF2 family DNA or RNA helicase